MAGTRIIRDGLEATDRGFPMYEGLIKTERETLAFISGETVKSFILTATATVTMIILEMPAFSGAVVTGVISIENSDGVEIYASSACAEDTVHQLSLDPAIPLIGTNTIKVTLSTNPLSSGDCHVTLYLNGYV